MRSWRGEGPWLAVALVLLLTLTLGAALWIAKSAPAALIPASASAPGAAPPAAVLVDNVQCLACHAEQARQWQASHHARAMAAATPTAVRGDFNDARFTHRGVTSRFFRRGDKFMVHTDGPDGRLADFEISHTFGVDPLQQYLIAMPGGRLQPLQIAWDTRARRWFHLRPDERAPAGDVLHWTGRYQTANTQCLACHTTGFEKRYDPASDRFASTWREPNVSCQSCHGPGDRHLRWARAKAEARTVGAGPDAAALAEPNFGLTLSFKTLSASRQTEVCAACHARRTELVATALPGPPQFDSQLPSLLQPGLYHADGQQLDEVFVDGSFRQSKMHQQGVGCSACHNPHSGQLKLAGNALCLQCHSPQANPAFPKAAGLFDAPSHHFHPAGSAGAQCVNCHMPSKTYMQVQQRPDHSLRIPRPDLSVKIGTPNACNACHGDRSAQWAADRVAAWYGPQRRQAPHYGEVFAAAIAGQSGAGDGLAQLSADLARPPIVRASALAALRDDPSAGHLQRIAATRDADPEVRAAAADSLDALPANLRAQALTPLLTDAVRAVRIAAARSLSALPPTLKDTLIEPQARPAFESALAEYLAVQRLALDMPGAQLNLAVVFENLGQADLAEQHYLAALRIDPDFTPARANLARLYNAGARNADAERVLSEGVRRLPAQGDLQYSLGLLLAEEKRLPEAAQALTQAARLLPGRAKVHYNLGLALQQLGRRQPAEAALLQAQRLAPADPAMAYALAVLHAQAGRRAQALAWGEKLQALAPADAQVHQFVDGLRGAR